MSVTIPGVPATVTRGRVIELIEALGIDPAELVTLRFDKGGIYAEVYADQHGHTGHTKAWRFTTDGENGATHKICIPIDDGE